MILLSLEKMNAVLEYMESAMQSAKVYLKSLDRLLVLDQR